MQRGRWLILTSICQTLGSPSYSKFVVILLRTHSVYYEDESWRIQLLTLNYYGQEIDLAGARGEIFNVQQGCWEDRRCNLDERLFVDVYGIRTWVDTKENLLRYKWALGRSVDIQDCREMQVIIS